MRAHTVVALLALLSSCSLFTGPAVRALGEREKEALEKLNTRLAENRSALRTAAEQLDELAAEYTTIEFEAELALSKAKLLESMRAPWASPTAGLAETQRAVALYHLYELEQNQMKVLQARIDAQRVAEQQLVQSSEELQRLVTTAGKNLQIVLRHLNQPRSAQIRAFADSFLAEVAAFRGQLGKSDNPRLVALAQRVERYEQNVQETKTRIDRVLDTILKTKDK